MWVPGSVAPVFFAPVEQGRLLTLSWSQSSGAPTLLRRRPVSAWWAAVRVARPAPGSAVSSRQVRLLVPSLLFLTAAGTDHQALEWECWEGACSPPHLALQLFAPH